MKNINLTADHHKLIEKKIKHNNEPIRSEEGLVRYNLFCGREANKQI